MSKFKSAFTLAEVLLTMSIVGIVAAMTIPTLYYQRIKKEYSVKLKHFYSRMDNAILDMELEKGAVRDMRQPDDSFQWYLDNLDPYYGHVYVDKAKRQVYFKDGSVLKTFYKGGCLDVDLDVNGDKAPNKEGYDMFRFLYCFTDDARKSWFGNKDIFFGSYGSGLVGSDVSRDAMISHCKSASTRSWCTRLLQNDGWEFKSDYPLKF